MKKDKIESVCFIVPSLQKGGMERVLSLLCNRLLDHIAIIHIITLTNDIVEYEFDHRINIIHVNKKLRNRYKLVYQVFRVLKRLNSDVVVGFSEVFNPITIIASKLSRTLVVVSDRSSPLIKYSVRDYWLKKMTYIFANGIIAQTNLAKQKLQEKKLNSNIVVIPNPVTPFSNNRFNYQTKTIITVGRLTKSKNQLELIKIFQEINNSEWKLMLIGDGNFRSEIERYINSNNLNNHVKLLGKKNNIEKELSRGSIFAFTSLSEGFPNVVLEALSFPLATIAYDCPAGVSDLIENGKNGYLIPLHDRRKFKERLESLMSNEDERLRLMKTAIESRNKYSLSDFVCRFYNFVNTFKK